jgi:hypothetical protein
MQASEEFQGTSYNLLTKNCNHFTSYLCEKLTGRSAPGWINRAASIGVALPCVVPREWIAPPDYDTADGELLDEDFDESSSMLRHERPGWQRTESSETEGEEARLSGGSSRSGQEGARGNYRYAPAEPGPRVVHIKGTDSSGHKMPPAERAPMPKNLI